MRARTCAQSICFGYIIMYGSCKWYFDWHDRYGITGTHTSHTYTHIYTHTLPVNCYRSKKKKNNFVLLRHHLRATPTNPKFSFKDLCLQQVLYLHLVWFWFLFLFFFLLFLHQPTNRRRLFLFIAYVLSSSK